MKWVKTLLLFLILVVIAAYVYFYEIKGGEERQKEKEIAEKVLNFTPDSVKAIDIRSIMNQFYFERSSDGWKINSRF